MFLWLIKDRFSEVVAKKSPGLSRKKRVRENSANFFNKVFNNLFHLKDVQSNKWQNRYNPYLKGEPIKFHVAKKSVLV